MLWIFARYHLPTFITHQLTQGRLFFVDGPGGTGKTFVYSLLLDTVRSQGDIAIAVASSGLAALLMPGGRTSHSRFGIPIPIEGTTHCK